MLLPGWSAASTAAASRSLYFRHVHTGESLAITYWSGDAYRQEALRRIDHLLRDFRTDEVHPVDPGLLDILHEVATRAGHDPAFEVISGYRSPATNSMLCNQSTGVARKSLHVQGRAIDVRLDGVASERLRDIALDMKKGGVGYYRKSDFVHLDTGRFRTW